MKTTPRQLALLISLIISFACATLLILSLFLDIRFPLVMIIASTIIIFIIAYFLIFYAVNNFHAPLDHGPQLEKRLCLRLRLL